MQGGKAENLEKRRRSRKTVEESKPTRFKKRSIRHPHLASGRRARHARNQIQVFLLVVLLLANES